MEYIIKVIQRYYNEIEMTDADFNRLLMKCSKEDLIEFIREMQNRKCFDGICYKI